MRCYPGGVPPSPSIGSNHVPGMVVLQRALSLRRTLLGPAPFQRSFYLSSVLRDEKKKEDKPQIRGTPYSQISIGVPKETKSQEKRVAQTPATVAQLVKSGFNVFVESGAGVNSNFSDEDYKKSGASVVSSKEARCYSCFYSLFSHRFYPLAIDL